MRNIALSLVLLSLLLTTGCPPARLPFEDRWVLDVADDFLVQGIEKTLRSEAPDHAGAVITSSNAADLAFQSELEFRMNGVVTETITLGKDPIKVDGEYQLLSQSNGEYRLKLIMGQKRTTSDVRLKVSDDRRTMTTWITRDGKESISRWKRAEK